MTKLTKYKAKVSRTYKGNVLLVDDSTVSLFMGNKILASLGLNVVTAINGEEAIEYCKAHKFNLIFMDIEMPGLGGLATASILREQKISYAPIYALTANGGNSIRLQCTIDMNGLILKPLRKDKLGKILDKIIWETV